MAAKIFAIINQKGGVGKSTTAEAMASGLTLKGFRCLSTDLDAQGNMTYTVNGNTDGATVLGVLMGEVKPFDAIQHTDGFGDIIVSSKALSGADGFITVTGKEYRLKEALEKVCDMYDYIIIDTPPALGILTVNALTAADSIIIPVQCEYFALEGIGKLLNTIKLIKGRLNPKLEIEGFLLTMYDNRLKLCNQIYDEVKRHFQELVFKTVIQRNVKLAECPSHGLPVILYDVNAAGTKNHLALAKEIISREKHT